MRTLALAPLVAATALLAAAPAGGGRVSARRERAGAGISVRVPVGWRLVRRSLTDVTDPAQRLAVASFPVRLAAAPCACGKARLRDFPRAGAFVFAWEYSGAEPLTGIPRRPPAFHVAPGRPYDCARPTSTRLFRDAGRVFQVEVFLGPAATPRTRANVDALLDSLRVQRLMRTVARAS
jgi:hypothetical protein